MTIEERKTALVFGGARGIGAAAVRRLAKDGYDVAFTYVSRPDSAKALMTEIEEGGRRAVSIQADSADAEAIRAAVAKTVDAFGLIEDGDVPGRSRGWRGSRKRESPRPRAHSNAASYRVIGS